MYRQLVFLKLVFLKPAEAKQRRRRWLCLLILSALQTPVMATDFRVLVDDAHPPFSYLDQQRHADGMVVQMLSLVLAEVPVAEIPVAEIPSAQGSAPPQIEAMPWHRIMLTETAVANTLFASVARTPERESQFVWVSALFHQPVSLYALRERRLQLRTSADLTPYRIGTPRNSVSHRQLLTLGVKPEQIDTGGDPVQNLRKLIAGRLDLITMQPAVLTWHLQNEGLTGVRFQSVFPILPATEFYLAASLGTDPALVSTLQATFARLERAGAFLPLRQGAGLDTASAP